jgi:signal recognition particle receptor subunit alpha
MLDDVVVVSKGGLVLFRHSLHGHKEGERYRAQELQETDYSALNELIRKVLIEEGAGKGQGLSVSSREFVNMYVNTEHSKVIKYLIDNQHGWIVAGLLPSMGSNQLFGYVDTLLLDVQKSMARMSFPDNEEGIMQLRRDIDGLATSPETKKEASSPVIMRKFEQTEKFQNVSETTKQRLKGRQNNEAEGDMIQESFRHEVLPLRLDKARTRETLGQTKQAPFSRKEKKADSLPTTALEAKKKDGKKPLKWDEGPSVEEATSLDYSSGRSSSAQAAKASPSAPIPRDRTRNYDLDDIEYVADGEDVLGKDQVAERTKDDTTRWSGFFKSLALTKTLAEEDLLPVLAKMQEHLVAKNVASSTAESLCDSVKMGLIGQNVSSLKSAAKLVKEALEVSLRKVLTPKQSIDILRDIDAAKEQGRPYVVVFCGVNGVGKSTNLAKVCFWLLQNQLRILIAACDTFRSGAVEQLRVHVRNLQSPNFLDDSLAVQVDLYEKGYGKDAAGIAKDAIAHGKLILIDRPTPDFPGKLIKVLYIGSEIK